MKNTMKTSKKGPNKKEKKIDESELMEYLDPRTNRSYFVHRNTFEFIKYVYGHLDIGKMAEWFKIERKTKINLTNGDVGVRNRQYFRRALAIVGYAYNSMPGIGIEVVSAKTYKEKVALQVGKVGKSAKLARHTNEVISQMGILNGNQTQELMDLSGELKGVEKKSRELERKSWGL
jgi:hypothetical protein